MSTLPLFSHIYVEEKARSYPLTATILERFAKATQVSISNYKEVFNRPRQRWDHQQQSLKLILAVREDSFLYAGSSFVPNYDHSRFFYTTPILNCIYGCEYCYLQGLLSSPNMVVFVNDRDFIEAAEKQLGNSQPGYLCISYDTDLLAIEDIFGYCATWIEYARRFPNVTVEIRTKSANIKALRGITPPPNVILAWTLSPEQVIERFEHKTPSLAARLSAVATAQELGWSVRLCIDPILRVQDWQTQYAALVRETFERVSPTKIVDVSVGVFRINSGYLRNMQERRPSSKLVTYPYTVENGAASYKADERSELLDFVSSNVRQFVTEEKICPVPWQS